MPMVAAHGLTQSGSKRDVEAILGVVINHEDLAGDEIPHEVHLQHRAPKRQTSFILSSFEKVLPFATQSVLIAVPPPLFILLTLLGTDFCRWFCRLAWCFLFLPNILPLYAQRHECKQSGQRYTHIPTVVQGHFLSN